LINALKDDFDTAILLITHDLGVVAEMARWVGVMYAGRIVEFADVGELFADPKHPYTLGLMASIPKLADPVPPDRMLPAIPGMVPSLLNLPPGCTYRDRCPRAFSPCGKTAPPLFMLGNGHTARCWLYE
jgi:oligopeptide/dipeptide ABC transporter ATP-binding protein